MSSLRESMRIAARDYGKGRLSQVLEIARLALGPSYMSASEYYEFRLFDDSQFSFLQKQQFLGYTGQEHIKKILINDRWRILADDKFVFATLFRSQELPLARILATYKYKPNIRACSIPSLNTTDELTSFLKNGVEYPFFGKPINANYGAGCIGVDSLDRTVDQMTLANQQTVTIDEFVEMLQPYADGYLFQERMRPHRVIRDICGNRIATVRIVVLVGFNGPKIHRAIWKIPAGKNMTDHFVQGRSGNLIAAIDIEDGKVGRVISGQGVNEQYPEYHPDTGKHLDGLTLPCWREVKELCLEAAMVLPGLRLQSWDIAICEEGPVLQEVQDGGFTIVQICSRQGLLDDQFRQHLKSVNNFWRREIALSILSGWPRRVYRYLYPKHDV